MSPDIDQITRRFGRVVLKHREAKAWSQIKLAEKADLNFNYIGSVERGDKLASIGTVVKLARAFGTTAAELMRQAGL